MSFNEDPLMLFVPPIGEDSMLCASTSHESLREVLISQALISHSGNSVPQNASDFGMRVKSDLKDFSSRATTLPGSSQP